MTVMRYIPFDDLPLFATDDELALAIFGRKRASEWRQFVAYFERKGMPTMDPIVGARYRPAVKVFFDQLWNLDRSSVPPMQDGVDVDTWNVRRRRTPRKAT